MGGATPEPGLLNFIINEFRIRAFSEQGEAGVGMQLGGGGCEHPTLGGLALDPGGPSRDLPALRAHAYPLRPCSSAQPLLLSGHLLDAGNGLGGARNPGVPGNLGF